MNTGKGDRKANNDQTLTIEQHTPHKVPGMNPCVPEEGAVPA